MAKTAHATSRSKGRAKPAKGRATNPIADTGMAFVLIQHMDPAHESQLTDLLSKATRLPVTEVTDGMAISPDEGAKRAAFDLGAGLAAEQASDADLEDLRRVCAEMEPAPADPQLFAVKDDEFHRRLAQTTHNPLLILLLDSIRAEAKPGIWANGVNLARNGAVAVQERNAKEIVLRVRAPGRGDLRDRGLREVVVEDVDLFLEVLRDYEPR